MRGADRGWRRKRHVPSSYSSTTTEAAWEARDETIQPYFCRKATCLLHSLSSPCDHSVIGQERGLQYILCLVLAGI
jgi:hypothetical protein